MPQQRLWVEFCRVALVPQPNWQADVALSAAEESRLSALRCLTLQRSRWSECPKFYARRIVGRRLTADSQPGEPRVRPGIVTPPRPAARSLPPSRRTNFQRESLPVAFSMPEIRAGHGATSVRRSLRRFWCEIR